MKAKYIIVLIVSCFLLSCSSTKSSATPEQIETLDALVAGKSFEIKSDWAYPQASSGLLALQNSGLLAPGDANAGRFSLIGNPNHFRLSDDNIDSYLPYFGERQMVTDRSGNGSIEFKNTIKDYEVTKKDNNSYIIKFSAKSHNENFNVIVTLFPSLKSEIMLQGAKRFPIRYSGKVVAISE
ncbi:DUF4251 domain-containing protein [Psychroserpens luteolus]|uniref:DUF4251 domain-containing protein n=1 Tax=Psychroserpens luteolus TaxID=2855840 RepID=UPI001E3751FF|nr:DUF4251 domain-containing protein [Psychroserpens luteolus]MCD2258795.1 DUF4251 domain-containing protein [Psychroserpens luteolus]